MCVFYRKAHRKALESQKKHQKEVEQLEEELNEVQQAMRQFEQEGDSQGDDLQLMDSQVNKYMQHFNLLISLWSRDNVTTVYHRIKSDHRSNHK